MKLYFPEYATSILNTIEDHGFEAWFVGGCVRDCLIGRDFYDIDITTNALPDEIEKIFSHTVPTGKKHGTITVLSDSNSVEVTTYRSESGYYDNRHPNEVLFEEKIENDLSRRDFTINAIAYHPTRCLLDLFDGINDLNAGIVKTVGDAKRRFSEDALRILRAFRFASVLNFNIDNDTLNAALSGRKGLKNLSGERILSEIKKLSLGHNPFVLSELLNLGALRDFGIGPIKLKAQKIVNAKAEYKPAFFISLCEHDITLIKEKLKSDNKLIKNIAMLDSISTFSIPNDKYELKLILNKIDGFTELYLEYIRLFYTEKYNKIGTMLRDVLENNEPYLISHLKINGYDLKKLGINGKEIRETLDILIKEVIYDPRLNTVARLKQIINK